MSVYLYEDNAGGLYVEREAIDYESGRRVYTNAELITDSTFVADAVAIMDNPSAWADETTIGPGYMHLDEMIRWCGDDYDRIMDEVLSSVDMIAEFDGSVLTFHRQGGNAATRYLFGSEVSAIVWAAE